jgi:hypothetical protein
LEHRRARAVALRNQGASYDAIAAHLRKELGLELYSKSHAFKDVSHQLKELNALCAHDAEEVRRQELERLDEYLFRLSPAIARGDAKAIDSAVKISERRCKMLGIDAPVQIQVDQIVNAELTNLIDGLQLMLPAETYETVLSAIATLSERSKMTPIELIDAGDEDSEW